MDNAVNPQRHCWEGDTLHVWYAGGVEFLIGELELDRKGRLWADVTASIGPDLANQARIDLMDQRQRVEFHAIAAMRDGNVPWQALMVPIIPLLRQGPQDDEREDDAAAPASMVPVEPFPVDIFPAKVKALIDEGASALPCRPDLVGVHVIAVLAAAIGATHVLEVKQGWHESARCYVGVVEEPGSKKSPAYKIATDPLRHEQERLARQYDNA